MSDDQQQQAKTSNPVEELQFDGKFYLTEDDGEYKIWVTQTHCDS